MCRRRPAALRAGSVVGFAAADKVPCEAAVTSNPAVKARGPEPVRTMARTEGSWERVRKMEERFSHILGELLVHSSFGR